MRRRAVGLVMRWIPMLAWMGILFYLSNQPKLPHPGRRMGISDYLFDYTAHAFMFGVLALLVWRVLDVAPDRWRGHTEAITAWRAALVAALYAISDEVHQAFVAGRTSSPKDALADFVGILLCVVLIGLWVRFRVRLHFLPDWLVNQRPGSTPPGDPVGIRSEGLPEVVPHSGD